MNPDLAITRHLEKGMRSRSCRSRHSREGGNPFLPMEQVVGWIPAYAGMTCSPAVLYPTKTQLADLR